MGRLSKSLALILIIIMAVSSLMMVESTCAQTIPKPSIPQFSLNYFSNSVQVTVVNQPFTPNSVNDSISGNNFSLGLFYDIRWKEHSASEWTNYYPNSYLFEATNSISGNNSLTPVTVITYGLNGTIGVHLQGISAGSVDFQVEALIGYYFAGFNFQVDEEYHFPFYGEDSGYSETQTIVIPASSFLPTPSPTSSQSPETTPTVPEFPILAILPLFLSTFLIATKFLRRKYNWHE